MYDEYQHRYSNKNTCKWYIYGKVRQLSFKQKWNEKLLTLSWFFFFFFDLGFTALSRIFHLYRADRWSEVGENRSTRRKTTWPTGAELGISHVTRARLEPTADLVLKWHSPEKEKRKVVSVKDHKTFSLSIKIQYMNR